MKKLDQKENGKMVNDESKARLRIFYRVGKYQEEVKVSQEAVQERKWARCLQKSMQKK